MVRAEISICPAGPKPLASLLACQIGHIIDPQLDTTELLVNMPQFRMPRHNAIEALKIFERLAGCHAATRPLTCRKADYVIASAGAPLNFVAAVSLYPVPVMRVANACRVKRHFSSLPGKS